MPGLRFKLWPVYAVSKHPWVQVPAGEIGVVIAQVGDPIAIGAKSAEYQPEFGNFADLDAFLDNGGQKGVQRPVLPPGTLAPIHPAAFLVITASRVYGVPVSSELQAIARQRRRSAPEAFGLRARAAAGHRASHRRATSPTWSASSPPSRASRCRPATSPAASAGFDDVVDDGGRRTQRRRDHRHAARPQERAAQQLPGLPGVPGRRRPHRPAARPAAVRRLPAEPVPGERRDGADAGGAPGRGRGGEELRRPAHARHQRRRVQVRLDRAPGSARHLAGAAAHRQVPDQPAHLRGRDRAHVDPHAELGERRQPGAQPRLVAQPDRGQEPRGLRVPHRPAGADPRAATRRRRR